MGSGTGQGAGSKDCHSGVQVWTGERIRAFGSQVESQRIWESHDQVLAWEGLMLRVLHRLGIFSAGIINFFLHGVCANLSSIKRYYLLQSQI